MSPIHGERAKRKTQVCSWQGTCAIRHSLLPVYSRDERGSPRTRHWVLITAGCDAFGGDKITPTRVFVFVFAQGQANS